MNERNRNQLRGKVVTLLDIQVAIPCNLLVHGLGVVRSLRYLHCCAVKVLQIHNNKSRGVF